MLSSKKMKWFSGLLIPIGMALVPYTPDAVDVVILALVGVANAITKYFETAGPVPE